MENYDQNFSIKNWAEDDRPREKLMLKGKAALSDAELIAILIGSGNKGESAVELSKRILKSANDSLIDLSKLSISNLVKSFKGIGEAKAISIIAALELGKRRRSAEVIERKIISSSKDAFELMHSMISDCLYEEFWIIMLNKANKVIKYESISEGGISETVADPKKIFKMALENNATSMILCHNHPSGNLKPSDADIKLTKKLKEAGLFLEILVVDHIIIGDEKYYSFADEGIL
ncbi:MAG: DNA repair protein RadC [Bacteroidetes bacterium]|nr:DNA repair protein RadC [Bacteroidota bacterium]